MNTLMPHNLNRIITPTFMWGFFVLYYNYKIVGGVIMSNWEVIYKEKKCKRCGDFFVLNTQRKKVHEGTLYLNEGSGDSRLIGLCSNCKTSAIQNGYLFKNNYSGRKSRTSSSGTDINKSKYSSHICSNDTVINMSSEGDK